METKRTEHVEYRYSTGFWLRKLLYLLLAALLAWLIWWLLTYKENTVDVVKEEPKQQVAEVQDSPEATPVEPVTAPVTMAPFSITLPGGLEEPTKKPNSSTYTYKLNDDAELTINLDGGSDKDADLRWTHDLQEPGQKLNLVSKSEQLCEAGTAGCSAGNGVMEISVTRAMDDYRAVRFDIVDTENVLADAQELYEPLLESFVLNTEGEE